jgi:acyl-ACP thioesterase
MAISTELMKVNTHKGLSPPDRVRCMAFRDAALSFEMVARTSVGREFTARRRVRLGDATPNGRLRLDALARYLQDVSNDDTRVSEWSDPHWWVVRRTVVDVHEFPKYMEEIDLVTWCGGLGSHWAERRTQILSLDGRVLIDAAALWVHIDQDTMQPSRVPEDVVATLTESSGGRSVGARLLLRDKLFDAVRAASSPWPLRFSDFDAVGHMNNAAYWEIVEEHLAEHRDLRAPLRAVVEHVIQVDPGQSPMRQSVVDNNELDLELTENGTMHSAMWCGVLS